MITMARYVILPLGDSFRQVGMLPGIILSSTLSFPEFWIECFILKFKNAMDARERVNYLTYL